ncbi:MAG: hypothetical protein JWP96_2673 [Polaromonas sp.]|nr:hypothetical protein [Polaromonas sp.]
MMRRVVSPETLDSLAESDPAAQASRRDLQRVHRVMGTQAMLVHALRRLIDSRPADAPLRLLELGAGDGSLMLGVARELKGQFPAVELTLLDRQSLVSRATVAGYADAGWTATAQVIDVFDWMAGNEPAKHSISSPWDLIVSNLFLHHFEGPALKSLLAAIEARSLRFFACEPHRDRLALAASHAIGAMGANAVTRKDAVLSVHAGFRAWEISALWPENQARWALSEYPSGLFSHCFYAGRINIEGAGRP